jgi:hypothetical protein
MRERQVAGTTQPAFWNSQAISKYTAESPGIFATAPFSFI